jgi:hypothetical protein
VASIVSSPISEVLSSYKETNDLLREGLQNACDAVLKAKNNPKTKSQQHFINLVIDKQKREISFIDSGNGFKSEQQLKDFLCPFSSDKREDYSLTGEKGVGMTYLCYSVDQFTAISGKNGQRFKTTLKDGSNWINSPSKELFDPKNSFDLSSESNTPVNAEQDQQATIVSLAKLSSKFNDLFSYNVNELEYILRTETTIGRLDDKLADVKVTISLIDIDGSQQDKVIKASYFDPEEFFINQSGSSECLEVAGDSYDAIELRQTKSQQKKLDITKLFKAAVVQKTVANKGRHKDLDLNFKVCAAKASDILAKAVEAKGLTNVFSIGLQVCDNNVPTGIPVELMTISSINSNHLRNAFGYINTNKRSADLETDIGRKVFSSSTQKMIKDAYQKEINPDISRFLQNAPSKNRHQQENMTTTELWNQRQAQIQSAIDLPDLNIKGLNILKQPDNEASVASLFHELNGQGYLNYKFYKATYSGENDIILRHPNGQAALGEYKLGLADFCRDVTQLDKIFHHTEVVICWDVDNIPDNFLLNPVETVSDNNFDKVNYYLQSGNLTVQVLCLKDICQELKTEDSL